MNFRKLTAVLLAGLMTFETIPFQPSFAESQPESTVENIVENVIENQTETLDDVEIPPSQTSIDVEVASKIYAPEAPKEEIANAKIKGKTPKDVKSPSLKAAPLNQEMNRMSASSAADYSSFNTLTAPSIMNNLINKKYAMTDSEKISPLTGDLTYSQTDLVLPGRNGLDLIIGRTYQSNQSLLGDRKYTYKGEQTQENSTYLNNRYFLGAGWTFNFPSVEVRKNENRTELFYHNGFGQVEHVLMTSNPTDDSNLENHYAKDVRFDNDTSFSNGQVQSAYVYVTTDQTKQFFATDGRFIGVVDRFNNKIILRHSMQSISNIMPNYDFMYASGTEGSGWPKITFPNGGCDLDTTEGKGDNTSLKYWSNNAGTPAVDYYSRFIEVAPETTYRLEAYVKNQLETGQSFIGVSEYKSDSLDSFYYVKGNQVENARTGDWTKQAQIFTTSKETRYVRVYFKNSGKGVSRIDKVKLGEEYPLISDITDSLGRVTTFTYTNSLYDTTGDGDDSITVKTTDPTSGKVSTLRYEKSRVTLDYRILDKLGKDAKLLFEERRIFPYLRLASALGDVTTYGYEFGSSKYTCGNISLKEDSWQGHQYNLQTIINSTQKTVYNYEPTIKSTVGCCYETWRICSRADYPRTSGGYNESKPQNQQTYKYYCTNKSKVYMNESGYPEGVKSDDENVKVFTTMVQNNGLKQTWEFAGGKLKRTAATDANGEEQAQVYETYHKDFKDSPLKIRIEKQKKQIDGQPIESTVRAENVEFYYKMTPEQNIVPKPTAGYDNDSFYGKAHENSVPDGVAIRLSNGKTYKMPTVRKDRTDDLKIAKVPEPYEGYTFKASKISSRTYAYNDQYSLSTGDIIDRKYLDTVIIDKWDTYVRDEALNTCNDADRVEDGEDRRGNTKYVAQNYGTLRRFYSPMTLGQWYGPEDKYDQKAYFVRKGNLYSYVVPASTGYPADSTLNGAVLEGNNVDVVYKDDILGLTVINYKSQNMVKVFYTNIQSKYNKRYNGYEPWKNYNEYTLTGAVTNYIVYNSGKTPQGNTPDALAPLTIELRTSTGQQVRITPQVFDKGRQTNIAIVKLPGNLSPILFGDTGKRNRRDFTGYNGYNQNIYEDTTSSIYSYFLSTEGDLYKSDGTWDASGNLIITPLSQGLGITKISAYREYGNIIMVALSNNGKVYEIEVGEGVSTDTITPNLVVDPRVFATPTILQESKQYVENTYNDWGGLASTTKPMTEAQLANPGEKQKLTTSYEYHPTYKFPTKTSYYQNNDRQIVESCCYTSLGQLEYSINAKGDKTTFEYGLPNYPGLATKQTQYMANGKTSVTTLAYGPSGGTAFPTEASKPYTKPDGSIATSTTRTDYDLLFGSPVSTTDPKGNKTQYAYDDNGRVKTVTYPAVSETGGQYVYSENYTYEPAVYASAVDKTLFAVTVRKTKTPAAGGTPSLYDEKKEYYDRDGKLHLSEQRTTELGRASTNSYAYDNYGQLSSSRNPNGNQVTYSFDSWGRVKSVTDPYGNSHLCDYDIFNRTKTTSFLAAGTGSPQTQLTETYDQWDRLIKRMAYPNGSEQLEERYNYDYVGNVIDVTNPKGETTRYTYSPANELVRVTEPSGDVVDYSYNSFGALTEQKQYEGAKAFTKKKDYDERGVLTQLTEANGRVSKYICDAMGLPTEINEAGSRIKKLNYDALNRVTQITSGDESLKTSYGTYGIEKLESLKVGTATSTLNFGYNPRGLVSERISNGKTTRFEYDLAGNLTKMTTPEKLVQSYTYNQREQVETLTADGKTFTYAYYPNGLLRSTTYPSFNTGVTLSCTYSYDNAKRLTEMSYTKNGAPYVKYSYGYDQNGNIISEKVNDVLEKSYTFNNRGQLATTSFKDKGTRTYAYDSRGNRTKATGPVTELKDKTETTYSWDAWDRLSNVKQGNETLASFKYDASGIRTTKTTDQGTTTYDCDNSGRVITESTEDGVKAQNIWGNGILARKADGAFYYYLTNTHGDVMEILDETGKTVNRYKYDEWGNALEAVETIENPIRFAGEYFDEETSLYYLRARYYDPSLARFISKDSYEGQVTNPQSLNQYSYCTNNPIMFVDPTGHDGVKRPIKNDGAGSNSSINEATASTEAGAAGGSGSSGVGWGTALVPVTEYLAKLASNPTLQAEIDQAAAGGNPVDLAMMGIPYDKLLDAGKAGLKGLKGFGVLTKASKYGIKPYSVLVRTLKGTGLQAHHILEKRFANIAGVTNCNLMQSVAVTKAEHQVFTNAWRRYIPYGTDYSTLSKDDLWSIAQRVYKDYPELIEAVKKTIYQ